MVLVIDNYDSFTYNLVQYVGELGVDVVVRRNNTVSVAELAAMAPERIIISPGPGRPEEAGISLAVIDYFKERCPILGVCLGHQAIGQVFGSQVVGAAEMMHGKDSPIHHDGRTIFRDIPSPFRGGRYHSLVVDRKTTPDCLQVTAETSDGVIMGLRHKHYQVEGVQFHPESILTEYGKNILKNFLSNGGRT